MSLLTLLNFLQLPVASTKHNLAMLSRPTEGEDGCETIGGTRTKELLELLLCATMDNRLLQLPELPESVQKTDDCTVFGGFGKGR